MFLEEEEEDGEGLRAAGGGLKPACWRLLRLHQAPRELHIYTDVRGSFCSCYAGKHRF